MRLCFKRYAILYWCFVRFLGFCCFERKVLIKSVWLLPVTFVYLLGPKFCLIIEKESKTIYNNYPKFSRLWFRGWFVTSQLTLNMFFSAGIKLTKSFAHNKNPQVLWNRLKQNGFKNLRAVDKVYQLNNWKDMGARKKVPSPNTL